MNIITRRAEGAKVAVIGMACRFPGGVDGAGSYWSLLLDCRTGITDIPADRWNP